MRTFACRLLLVVVGLGLSCGNALCDEPAAAGRLDAKKAWFRDAKFGMFVHWGLYSIPAGMWKGERVPRVAEWIQGAADIPAEEYEPLAGQFNPTRFDARQWARIAKNAGMRYITITAKHHDGFCLFDSNLTDYDVVDATPFGRDIIAELAEACRAEGLKLGLYYSIADWHHPEFHPRYSNLTYKDREFGFHGRPNLDADIKKYSAYQYGQVEELLENHGDVLCIWFDGGNGFGDDTNIDDLLDTKRMQQLAHSHGALLTDRLSRSVADYFVMADNQIPTDVKEDFMFETPATFNDTWAYKSYDQNWKDPEGLIIRLVSIVSRGGNYLLNVGPMGDGRIPGPSVNNLRVIGDWMKTNGEAIYGTQPSPYRHELAWGGLTHKAGRLYCILVDWPESGVFELFGLENRVVSAGLLGSNDTPEFTQQKVPGSGVDCLIVTLPKQQPHEVASVLWLDVEGRPAFDQSLLPVSGGKFRLNVSSAQRIAIADEEIPLDKFATVTLAPGQTLRWQAKFPRAGRFQVNLVTQMYNDRWMGNTPYAIKVDDSELAGTTTKDEVRDDIYSPSHFKDVVTRAGEVVITMPGTHVIEVRRAAPFRGRVKIRGVELLPAE